MVERSRHQLVKALRTRQELRVLSDWSSWVFLLSHHHHCDSDALSASLFLFTYPLPSLSTATWPLNPSFQRSSTLHVIQISGTLLDLVLWGVAQEVVCLKSASGKSWESKDSAFTLPFLYPF